MNYQLIYDSIIARSMKRTISGYFEKHHIIPKCIGGSDDPSNLSNLTAREHFVCHLLLTKIYPDSPGLLKAVVLMGKRTHQSSRTYQSVKIKLSVHMQNANPMFNPTIVEKFKKSRDWSKQSEVARKRNAEYWTSENRARLSERNTDRWSNAEARKAVSAKCKASWTPEKRVAASEKAKERWRLKKDAGIGLQGTG